MNEATIWNFLQPTLEIIILWVVIYRILVYFEGTRAFHVLTGLFYLLVGFLLAQFLGLDTLTWLLKHFFGISIVALMIIFQQELRQGLARLGQQHLFNITMDDSKVLAIIEEIVSAAYKLSQQKIGCLIAIEREIKFKSYSENGIQLDAKISSELLQSIFNPSSPLHDGGVVTRANRILATSCLFPLSDNPNFSKILGTRHRAALGITEQTDAVVVIVSEETGEISVAADGKFIPVVNRDRLINILKGLLVITADKRAIPKGNKT